MLGTSSTGQGNDPRLGGVQADQLPPGAPVEQEFAPTQIDENQNSATDWWSESTDGQCSEDAVLFAASQPAPLSVV